MYESVGNTPSLIYNVLSFIVAFVDTPGFHSLIYETDNFFISNWKWDNYVYPLKAS